MITQAFYDQVVLVFLPPQWGACVCPAGHPWWCVQGHQRGCTRLAGGERPPSACGIPAHLHWHPGASLHPGLLSAHCQVRMTGTDAAWTQIFTLKSGWIWFSERPSGPQLIDTLKYAGPCWWMAHFSSREQQLNSLLFFPLHTHNVTHNIHTGSFWVPPSLSSSVVHQSRLRGSGPCSRAL